MNKLILVFTAIAFAVGSCSQADSTNKRIDSADNKYGTSQDRDNNNNNNNQNMQNNSNSGDKSSVDGVVMQNGKLMLVKNGQTTVFESDMTMTNGTKITKDGTYTTKDGTKTTMKEGQHIDMSGNLIPSKVKTVYLVPDSAR